MLLTRLLANAYRLLSNSGRCVRRQDIERDITRLFRSNFEKWTALECNRFFIIRSKERGKMKAIKSR